MFKIDEDTIKDWSIDRIINLLGDGTLADNSECSKEFRNYLTSRNIETLERHINECVSNEDKNQKGFILQDIVNELGNRLEYSVEHGLYKGSSSSPGYDGLWKFEDSDIIVEVKSVSHYVIDFDKTLGKYKTHLEEQGRISKNSSNLIVVYDGDTKIWEQQINGTSYLYSTRIISVKWLVKLVKLKTKKTDDENTHKQIRQILKPTSYINIDKLIEILFSTVEDALEEDKEGVGVEEKEKRTVSTDKESIDETRKKSIAAFEKKLGIRLVQNTRALYWDETKKTRVACIVSKRYEGKRPYWYAYHPRYQKFFENAEQSYLLIGCTDKNKSYAVPGEVINKQVEFLTSTPPDLTTLKEGDKHYWHLYIKDDDGKFTLVVSKNNSSLNLEEFVCEFKE